MDSVFYVKLGKRVKELRIEKHLTQEQLAEKASIHPKFVGKIERALNKPSVDTLLKISKALDIKLEELFSFDYN